MTSDTANIFGKEIFVTKKPFNYFLILTITLGLSLGYLALITFRQFNLEASFATLIVFLCVLFIFYANFGQYLATINLYEYRIEINYIFPWNKSISFRFDKLIELDYKDIPFQNGRDRWYVGGKWLYLKNEKNEVLQFKYNINNSADKILLTELKKKIL
jgi:hypothetical protein